MRSLWVIYLSACLVPFTGSAINLALPELAEHFAMNAVTMTWVNTAYLVVTAVFQVPFARLADLFGRKKIFIGGLLLYALSSCMCALATSSVWLLVLRSFQGLSSAMIFSTSVAILTSIVAPNKRGQALGIQTMVIYISLASGPFFGGLLTETFGWQSIFIVPSLLALAATCLAFLFLKGEWREAKGERFDWSGSIIYAIALFGLIYGFTRLPEWEGILWLLTGVAGFIVFVRQENRCAFPVFNMDIFKGNKVFVYSSAAALINYAATSAIAFMISLYLQHIRGFSPHSAGLVLISQAITQSCCTYFSGRYSDKTSPFKLATTGMLIIVAGLLGLSFLSATTPLGLLIALLVLMGIGFGVFASPNMNIIMSSVDKRQYGQASAATGTVRQIGQVFSMSIATLVIYSHVGSAKITPEVYPQFISSLHITFLVFFLLCIIGTYASTVSGKSGKKRIGVR